MKRKILYAALVATVMGTANPGHAQMYAHMYNYYYYANGQLVGVGRDLCTKSGVIPQAEMYWGERSDDFTTELWGGCYEAQPPLD